MKDNSSKLTETTFAPKIKKINLSKNVLFFEKHNFCSLKPNLFTFVMENWPLSPGYRYTESVLKISEDSVHWFGKYD